VAERRAVARTRRRRAVGVAGPQEALAASMEQPLVDAADLERLARRVTGVQTCAVVWNSGARLPQEVRIVARGPRRIAVARDVQTAWYAVWGLYVPRGRFVVRPPHRPAERGRPRLRSVTVERARDVLEVAVTLDCRGRRLRGRASESGPASDVRRLAARATLEALGPVLSDGYRPELVELCRIRIAGLLALICAVSGPRGAAPLLGVCRLGPDEGEAAARATLDALNRILGR